MSVSSEREVTINIMPEVTHHAPESIDITENSTGAIALPKVVKKRPVTAQANSNTLPVFMLFVPLVFLLAIAAILLERTIKWGFRRFFMPNPSLRVATAYQQMATLE